MFKGALNEELGLATSGLFDEEASNERTSRVREAVYRIAGRLDPDAAKIARGRDGFFQWRRHSSGGKQTIIGFGE